MQRLALVIQTEIRKDGLFVTRSGATSMRSSLAREENLTCRVYSLPRWLGIRIHTYSRILEGTISRLLGEEVGNPFIGEVIGGRHRCKGGRYQRARDHIAINVPCNRPAPEEPGYAVNLKNSGSDTDKGK
jgi:hypothetical protein